MRGWHVAVLLFVGLAVFIFVILPTQVDPWTVKQEFGLAAMKKEDYRKAEQWLLAAYSDAKRSGAPDYETGDILGDLGESYENLKDYRKAEVCYVQGLALLERDSHLDNPELAYHLGRLGGFYLERRKLKQAEQYLTRALAIDEKALKPTDTILAGDLSMLGLLYIGMRRFDEAEPILKRAYDINKQALKPGDPTLDYDVQNLKLLETMKKKYSGI